MTGKMPQQFGLFDDLVTSDSIAVPPDLFDDLDQVIEMALGVDPAREGQTDQFQG